MIPVCHWAFSFISVTFSQRMCNPICYNILWYTMHIYTPHGIMEFLYPIHKQLDFRSIPMISGSRSGLSHSRLARPVTPWGIPSAATRPWWFCPKVQRRPALVGWPWWLWAMFLLTDVTCCWAKIEDMHVQCLGCLGPKNIQWINPRDLVWGLASECWVIPLLSLLEVFRGHMLVEWKLDNKPAPL